jgi:maleate cis-trans isomerase
MNFLSATVFNVRLIKDGKGIVFIVCTTIKSLAIIKKARNELAFEVITISF